MATKRKTPAPKQRNCAEPLETWLLRESLLDKPKAPPQRRGLCIARGDTLDYVMDVWRTAQELYQQVHGEPQ
jgi:hypothetical protein